MRPRYRWESTGPACIRLPYPQTPETARQWLEAHGVAVADLARRNQVDRSTLVGLKPEPKN